MRVLVACEYSGRVREAFRKRGHDAWSCDLLESEDESPKHIQCKHDMDIWFIIEGGWDLIIAHPPCTDLAVSGARHFAEKIADGRQRRALDFVQALMDAPCDRICIENPISVISSKIRKPDQIIQPWMFGHPEFKATCLWLKGLPKLVSTNELTPPKKLSHGNHTFEEIMEQQAVWNSWNKVHRATPGPNRWKERSRTYQGIADAMAEQWG